MLHLKLELRESHLNKWGLFFIALEYGKTVVLQNTQNRNDG